MNKKAGKIKLFFKPSVLKIIFLIVIMVYAFYTALTFNDWGHSISWFPMLLFAPLLLFANTLSLILFIPYSYILSCLIVLLFNLIKSRKWLLILVIFMIVLLTGADEPIVNNTINRPDYSCSIDSDCVVKSISRGYCGDPQCVSRDWEYYDSVINDAFALSCVMPLYSCSCIENKCETKDLYKSTNIQDCEKFEGIQKKTCIEVVSSNMNRANE